VRGVILLIFVLNINLSISQDSTYINFYRQEKLYEKDENNDSLELAFDRHLHKAIELNDTIEQLKVLRWKYWYSTNDLDKEFLRDRLNLISKDLGSQREFAANHYALASKEYYEGNSVEALTLFKNSLDSAIAANWKEGIIDNILAITGIYREANRQQNINSFLENTLSDLNNYYPDQKDSYKYWIYLEIAKNYLDNNNLSLAKYYKSLAISGVKLNKTVFNDHIIVQSLIDLKEGHYSKSKDSLILNLSSFHQSKLATVFYTISVALKKLNQSKESYRYLLRTDSILHLLHYPPFTNGGSLYEKLIGLTDDINTRNEFIGKSIYYNDSIRENRNLDVEQNQHSGLDFLILIFLIFLVIIISFFILKRNRTPRDKVRIKNFQEPIVNDEKSEVFEKLHSKILQWSAEKKFLNSNVSLSSLAAELNTNTAYLSYVFNKIIGVSFSEYISKHRVEYLVSKVKENPKLISNKSSIQIAEMGGFMSIDAYNSAFKKYLGKTPRQYFMEIV